MKIAISGTQCTGKTTLLNNLQKDDELAEYFNFTPEVIRSIKERNPYFKFNKTGDYDSQIEVFSEHARNLMKYKNLITDRCMLDAYIYALVNFIDGLFTIEELHKFREIALKHLIEYDLILYLPPKIDLESDGVRSVDKEYRDRLHENFMNIIEGNSESEISPEFIIVNDDLDNRLSAVKELIRGRINKF